MNKVKSKMLSLATLLVIMCTTSVFAAAGDFSMDRRVVNGYEQKTYEYSKATTKTVKCSAQYNIVAPYASLSKGNKLHVSVFKKNSVLFVTKWSELGYYECKYSNDKFSLNKKVDLEKGTYGFQIWRTSDDYYLDSHGNIIGYINISGNVAFK